MRRTPPVHALLQPQPFVQALVAALVALATGGLVATAAAHDARLWPALFLLPVAAAWAWRQAAVQPRRLRWDGQAWWLQERPGADEIAVRLTVLIDLDSWLLLLAGPGACWLPLSRSQQPHWHALRATLFAAPAAVDRA